MCRYGQKIYKPHFVCFDCRKTFKKPLNEDMIIQNGDWDKYQQAFIHPHSSWNFKYADKEEFQKENYDLIKYFNDKYFNKKNKCPECSKEMYSIGLDFKAPKKDKVKEWEIVSSMYRIGKTFHTCGCEGPGYIPHNNKDYLEYLTNIRSEYEKNLNKRKSELTEDELKAYLNYWTVKLNNLRKEIERKTIGNIS